MKFSLWTQYGALNSKPVFDAFRHSLVQAGHSVVENTAEGDVEVIWSVLWQGRMQGNQAVWQRARAAGKNVIVLEIGGIRRGTTWKVGLNGVNRDAYFGPVGNSDARAKQLGLYLSDWRQNDSGPIIICTQHAHSEQWRNMPSVNTWVTQTVNTLRQYTDRQIIIRHHPRYPVSLISKGVTLQRPNKIPGSYDDFDFRYNNAWAVVNWSSNPAVEAVRNGIPVFVGPNSLAYDVGNHSLETINNPLRPERQQWLNDLAHTEWTVDEIAQGLPLKNLTERL